MRVCEGVTIRDDRRRAPLAMQRRLVLRVRVDPRLTIPIMLVIPPLPFCVCVCARRSRSGCFRRLRMPQLAVASCVHGKSYVYRTWAPRVDSVRVVVAALAWFLHDYGTRHTIPCS